VGKVSIAGQMVYWRFGDKSYRVSGGVPAIALRKSIDAVASNGMKSIEVYQQGIRNLRR